MKFNTNIYRTVKLVFLGALYMYVWYIYILYCTSVRVLYKSISVLHMCDKYALFAQQTREMRKHLCKRVNP